MTDLTILNGDLRLAVSVHGPKEAPNILCLHGISNSRDTWQETVIHLQDRYRVWTLDFRGHGHSDRADSYLVGDYASDAAAVLEIINRPTIVVGHSLGGIVAVFLAQQPHHLVKAVFLEDPPMYLNEEVEWNKTLLSKVFPTLRDQQVAMQQAGASFTEFVEFAANNPAVQGGVIADHQTQRHVDSNGAALQRHDPSTWEPALNMTMLAAIDNSDPLKVPSLLIRADETLGPAFLAGHDERFLASNPKSEVRMYEGAPHRIHATLASEARLLADLAVFIDEHSVE
ncbi:MAG: alpha/beta hydrolase [Pseudomonadota bacterium]